MDGERWGWGGGASSHDSRAPSGCDSVTCMREGVWEGEGEDTLQRKHCQGVEQGELRPHLCSGERSNVSDDRKGE